MNLKSPHKIKVPNNESELYPFVEALHYAYNSFADVKAEADDIHHHRMMGGPACDQCIWMAIKKLGYTMTFTLELSK